MKPNISGVRNLGAALYDPINVYKPLAPDIGIVDGPFPHGRIFFGMRLPLLLQRQKATAAIGRARSWRPQRILLSHGSYFDSDADEVIRKILGWPPQ